MAMLPGWNSLEAVGSIGQALHMAAMVVLALLVIAQGLALVYDDRKYALIGAAEREIAKTHDQETSAIIEWHRGEIAALQRGLEETQRQQESLRLTIASQQTLIDALSPFPGQQIEIVSIVGDLEGLQFANNFASVAQQAGSNARRINDAAAANSSEIEMLFREPPNGRSAAAGAHGFSRRVGGSSYFARSQRDDLREEVASEVIRLDWW